MKRQVAIDAARELASLLREGRNDEAAQRYGRSFEEVAVLGEGWKLSPGGPAVGWVMGEPRVTTSWPIRAEFGEYAMRMVWDIGGARLALVDFRIFKVSLPLPGGSGSV